MVLSALSCGGERFLFEMGRVKRIPLTRPKVCSVDRLCLNLGRLKCSLCACARVFFFFFTMGVSIIVRGRKVGMCLPITEF